MTVDPWHVFTTNFGNMAAPSTAFVTLLDMILYAILTMNVSRARGKYKVSAPSVDGPDIFQRIYRVQMNTVEQLVIHLPLLWIAAFAMNDVFAASFGAVWLLGRVLYARGYYRKAKSRAKGFIICLAVNFILLIGGLAGTIASF